MLNVLIYTKERPKYQKLKIKKAPTKIARFFFIKLAGFVNELRMRSSHGVGVDSLLHPHVGLATWDTPRSKTTVASHRHCQNNSQPRQKVRDNPFRSKFARFFCP